MKYVLATLASVGVALLFAEIWGTYLFAKLTAQRQKDEPRSNPSVSLRIQYWRVALIILLELGVYVTWLTEKLLE